MQEDIVLAMKIAIMQPTYLPWLGYFDLMDQVDLFVLLDDVQFRKRSWQQRNRIKTPNGPIWLTVPVFSKGVQTSGTTIAEIEISDPKFWEKHAKTIKINYSKAEFLREYFDDLVNILSSNTKRLVELNVAIIEYLKDLLSIKTKLIMSSELNVKGKRSEKLAGICEKLGGNIYISPIGSAGYILEEIEHFRSRNIDVFFHNYEHPVYKQLHGDFIPYMSVIDLIFNEGKKSMEIIRSGRKQPYNLEQVKIFARDLNADSVQVELD